MAGWSPVRRPIENGNRSRSYPAEPRRDRPRRACLAGVAAVALGLGYNASTVKAAELPSTWDGLVNSRWVGRVIVDPRGKYLSGLALAWGQDKAVNWFKRLLAVDKPQQVEGATTSVEKVISGEALLTTSHTTLRFVSSKPRAPP